MINGAPVPGYHCYQNEHATMQIKLLGLFNVVNIITAMPYFNVLGQLINFTSDDRYAITDMKQYRFSTPVKECIQMNG